MPKDCLEIPSNLIFRIGLLLTLDYQNIFHYNLLFKINSCRIIKLNENSIRYVFIQNQCVFELEKAIELSDNAQIAKFFLFLSQILKNE